MGLAGVEVLGRLDIHQVLVVSLHNEKVLGPLQPVSQFLQG